MAALALGLVLSHRTSGRVNFAHAAMGMYVAYAYFEFRETGDLVLPVVGLPARVHLLARPTLASALVVAAVLAVAVGLVVYGLVVPPAAPVAAAGPGGRVARPAALPAGGRPAPVPGHRCRGGGAPPGPPGGPGAPPRHQRQPEPPAAGRRSPLAVAGVLTARVQVTRFGLATRAAADSEKGALLAGPLPRPVGLVHWAVASLLAGMAVIAHRADLRAERDHDAAARRARARGRPRGRLESFAITTVAGLAIGMAQSLILGYAVRPQHHLDPRLAAHHRAAGGGAGGADHGRAAVAGRRPAHQGDDRRPSAPRRRPHPRHVAAWTVVLAGGASVLLLTFDASLRQGLIVTMVAALLALSFVVVDRLQRPDLGGPAGLRRRRRLHRDRASPTTGGRSSSPPSLARRGSRRSLGILVGLPATRVRGMTLAVATLAFAVAIEELVLASPSVSGGAAGHDGAPPGPVRPRHRHQRPGRRQLPPGLRARGARGPGARRAGRSPTCAATAPGCAGWPCAPTSGRPPPPAST